jgi:hypothetical protein
MLVDDRTLRAEERPFSFFSMYLALVLGGVPLVCLSTMFAEQFCAPNIAVDVMNHGGLPVPTTWLMQWGWLYPCVPLALVPLWPLARAASRYVALFLPLAVHGLLVGWTWFGATALLYKSMSALHPR